MLARLILALSLICWSLLSVELPIVIGLMLLCMLLLLIEGSRGILFIRSLRLLTWLFIPIIVFHGLFTPGTYIQIPFYIPLSLEGMERALSLSAHIALMFFVALLFFRLLKASDWLLCLDYFPKLSAYLKPHLLLLQSLREVMKDLIAKQYVEWGNMDKKWLHLPDMFIQSLEKMLMSGKKEAGSLWGDWENRNVEYIPQEKSIFLMTKLDMLYAILVFAGWSLFWMK